LRTWFGVQTASVLAVIAVALFIGAGLLVQDHPVEWNYAPDLLEMSVVIGSSAGDIVVVIPADLPNEDAPIAIVAGDHVTVRKVPHEELSGLIVLDRGLIVLERVPDRLARLPQPDLVIGRYSLFGEIPLGLPADCGDCEGWVVVDDRGLRRELDGIAGMLGLEMADDNPPPGASAELRRPISLTSDRRNGSLEFLTLYGRGFNRGRLTVEVRLGDVVLARRDAAEPGGWQTVVFEVPAGEGTVDLVVAVVAEPGIEDGWDWGRASGVLVRHVDLGGDS
jgi:hypothetical protein